MRESRNVQYVKGRYLAETLNYTGGITKTTYPFITGIPLPEAASCSPGYQLRNNQCEFIIPEGCANDGTVYYSPCPAGYTRSPTDKASCISDACPSGYVSNGTNCIENCPTGQIPWSGDTTKCASDCVSLGNDANGYPLQPDTDHNRKCITAPPSLDFYKMAWWSNRASWWRHGWTKVSEYSNDLVARFVWNNNAWLDNVALDTINLNTKIYRNGDDWNNYDNYVNTHTSQNKYRPYTVRDRPVSTNNRRTINKTQISATSYPIPAPYTPS